MEEDKADMSRRLFSLTLEIIYLLTGEDYMVVKQCGDIMARRVSHTVKSGGVSRSCDTMDGKILKLSSKIIHLLTGEVRRLVGGADGCGGDITDQATHPRGSGAPPGRHAGPGERQSVSEEEEQGEDLVDIKVEEDEVGGEEAETFPEVSPGAAGRRAGLLYSRDEDDTSQGYQEKITDVKVVIIPHAEGEEEGGSGTKEAELPVDGNPNTEDKVGFYSEGNPALPGSMTPPSWPPNKLISLEDKIYVCYECGKCMVYNPVHQRVEAGMGSPLGCDCDKGSPSKPFHCSKCGKSFSSHVVFLAHQRVHTGDQSFSCAECGMTFSNKSILDTHQSIHTGDRPFSCLECGKCFAMKANLVKHLKIHRGDKPFSCQQCGKCFGMKSNLVKHQRVHTGEKPFQCSHCGRTFGMKSNLVKHQRIHTGEKPFKCLECGKCFASRSNLTTHEKIHTGEKPFTCTYCGKGFITSSDHSRHQKTHTGERHFMCQDCGKSFISRSMLTAHQKSHTSNMATLVASELLPENLDSC